MISFILNPDVKKQKTGVRIEWFSELQFAKKGIDAASLHLLLVIPAQRAPRSSRRRLNDPQQRKIIKMLCPFCKGTKSKVIDSRTNNGGASIRRRRECLHCERRFTTYEQVVRTPPLVIKRDSKRETFEREKIYKGLIKACDKRNLPATKIEEIIDGVENTIYEKYEREVPSIVIGELIIDQLKELDQVAYVRFASVYRRFEDISRFQQVIETLLQQKETQCHA